MQNLIVVDSLDKSKQIKSFKHSEDFDVLLLSDIVNDFNVLESIEMEELFFYFDESVKNKDTIQEISRILQVRQYYILDTNGDSLLEEKIDNARQVTYGNIKADALRKNIGILYENKISQMVRWLLFRHRTADANSIRRLLFNRATPVVLGIIAEAEQKIIDFKKEEYMRVAVEYTLKDTIHPDELETPQGQSLTDALSGPDATQKVHSFKLYCKTKFKKEHQDELNITMKTLRDENTSHIIKDLKRSTEEMKPYAPLTTARLQRSCFYLFNIDPIKTTSICEELCNGILVDGVKTKLITSPFTEGREISDDCIVKINETLIKKFGVNYVLPSKRIFENTDDEKFTKQEAIRPLYFTDKYFPARLKEKLPALHFEIYKFIFYRTLATQMKNSIYDSSKLIVEVDDVELVANAHKLEFDGWERLDGYRQRVSETDEDIREKEVIFPDNLFIGMEMYASSVSDYTTTDKNPPRYGKGRLLSILVESKLCRPETAHIIIDSMEKAGLVTERQHMMHPQEIGMIADAVFKEYAPELRSVDLLKAFELDILRVSNDEINSDEVENDYEVLKNDFEVAIGYEENSSEPDEWMIEKAKKVAQFHGDILTDDNPIFYSKQMILSYINAKENDLEKIGRCPECKKEQVVEDGLSFKCIDKNCKFVLYKAGREGAKGGISGFFDNFQKHVPQDRYKDILSILLKSNGKLYFDDLKKKTNDIFSAYVKLKKNTKFSKWELSLSFPKSKKAKINDSVKATNVLGSCKPEKQKEEVVENEVNIRELVAIDEYQKHIDLFRSRNITTTTMDFVLKKESENIDILSLNKEITSSLLTREVRFEMYEESNSSIRVLLVGEYFVTDLAELGLESLVYKNNVKVEVK